MKLMYEVAEDKVITEEVLEEATTGIIYRALFPNNKSYIGQTKNTLKSRKNSHKMSMKNKSKRTRFISALKKYGFENVKWEILISGLNSKIELNSSEKYFISFFQTTDKKYGYNMTPGGDGVEGMFGIKNHMFGKKHSKKSILKMKKNRQPLYNHTFNRNRISVYDKNNNRFKVFKTDERYINGELKIKEPKKYQRKDKKTIENNIKLGIEKRKETFKNKSFEEIENINKSKALKNGMASFFILKSPKNEIYIVSLRKGLKKFAEDFNLEEHQLYKYRNGKVPKNANYTDCIKLNKRLNTTDWEIKQYRRIKI